jgi:hypothetical protein
MLTTELKPEEQGRKGAQSGIEAREQRRITHLRSRLFVFRPEVVDPVVHVKVTALALSIDLPQILVDVAQGVAELQGPVGLVSALEEGKKAGDNSVDRTEYCDGDAGRFVVGGS